MKSAFDKIMAGIEDVTAFANGKKSGAKIVQPVDIKAIRARRKMSQNEFSKAFRLPIGTLRDWEQHRREPDSASKVYLSMIEADPEGVQKILAKV